MPKERLIYVRVTMLLLLLAAVVSAAEPRRISVYAPQTSYQIDILVHEGVDYVGITDLLEPLGRLESRVDGKKLTLIFNGYASEFQDGKRQYRTSANPKLELVSNFLLMDGRGYVSVASIVPLLPRITNQNAEFHAASRRLFIGATPLRYSAELRHSPSRLVLTFPVPVNPSNVIEKTRVRLFFKREPVVSSGADNVAYNDPFLVSTSFSELPSGVEFIANITQPATVSIGEGGRTVTITAVTPPPPAAPPAQTTAQQPSSAQSGPTGTQSHPAAAVRSRPFVILDAAHGGVETGEVLSPTLQEKAVNLAIARRLQKELEARGIPVVLTRIADNLLTWDQRAISANTSHASLYVALHASASGHGVRVYTSMLSAPPAGQTARSFLPWELAQSPYLAQSTVAASALVAESTFDGVPVHTSAAPIRPLNSVTIAAVAVEIAPLGASPDELASPEYQQKIATTLAAGIAALRSKLEVPQ